jgi:glycosyltransferase involved in cell wall biosynthesis
LAVRLIDNTYRVGVISAVIPALNDSVMLGKYLEALAAQSRREDEFIVVDSGSTDDTADIARRAGARVVSEPRREITAATAAGLDAARGTIIARLDADSRPGSAWLEKGEVRFENEPDLSAITGRASFMTRIVS